MYNSLKIKDEISRMTEGKIKNFSCRNDFKAPGKLLMDLKFSVLRDRFGDVLGILIVGSEVKGLQ